MLDEFIQGCTRSLESYTTDFMHTARDLDPSRVQLLVEQMRTHEKKWQMIKDGTLKIIALKQRECNRTFTPAIERSMLKVYEKCANFRGKGAFGETKKHMHFNVSKQTHQ